MGIGKIEALLYYDSILYLYLCMLLELLYNLPETSDLKDNASYYRIGKNIFYFICLDTEVSF